jgi:secreted PhoX family phosphatase
MHAAEDTNNHEINYYWFYNTVTKSLTRLASVPYGAEVTGSYFYPNINGWSYMLMNVQHPYEDFEDRLCALRNSRTLQLPLMFSRLCFLWTHQEL